MKQNKNHPHRASASQPAYPNAADSRYYASRAVNVVTALVSGMGFVSAMLLLVTMV